MVRLSVIVLSYNNEAYLAGAIESVLRQDIKETELIVLDDASTDGSPRVLEEFAALDSRVVAMYHRENTGIARALNDALDRAGGDYVSFLDGDDAFEPGALEKTLAVLAEDEDLIVWSDDVVIDASGDPTGGLFSELYPTGVKPRSGDLFEPLLQGNYISNRGLTFKRSNTEGMRFNEACAFLADYQFVLDLARRFRFFYIAEPLGRYRRHGSNVTSVGSDLSPWSRDKITVGKYILDEYWESMSPAGKAAVFATIAGAYSLLGSSQNARRFFLHSIEQLPTDDALAKALSIEYRLSMGTGAIRPRFCIQETVAGMMRPSSPEPLSLDEMAGGVIDG